MSSRMVDLARDIESRLQNFWYVLQEGLNVAVSYVPVDYIEALRMGAIAVVVTPMAEEPGRSARCKNISTIQVQICVASRIGTYDDTTVEHLLEIAQTVYDFVMADGTTVSNANRGIAYTMSSPYSQQIAIDQNSFVGTSLHSFNVDFQDAVPANPN